MNTWYILLGLKHSGKTTLGRLLAQSLDLPWFDTDNILQSWYLEKRQKDLEGYPAQIQDGVFFTRTIYSTHGSEDFTSFESAAFDDFLKNRSHQNLILSTGGAFVTNEQALEKLKSRSDILIFLDAPEEVLFRRIEKKGIPPFLEAKNLAESRKVWHTLYASRRSLALKHAHICVPCEELGISEILDRTLIALEEFNNGR